MMQTMEKETTERKPPEWMKDAKRRGEAIQRENERERRETLRKPTGTQKLDETNS